MERDYTTEVEEVLGLVQSDIQSDNYNFAPTTNGTGTTGVYNSWNTYNSSDTSYYTGLFGSVSRCFEAVRNFDAAYDGDPFNWCAGGGETIESFKNTISGIRDCMKLPSHDGDTVDSIKYKDTIFGDEYASLVASEGFEELMLESDSATATKYFFDQIITVNQDGSIEYDMDLILEIMGKSADDINSGQYDAIAIAYLYMSEEEMAQLMCACTNKVEGVEYGNNLGSAAGLMNEDYSSWEVDQEKYNNIYNSLSNMSNDYLITTYVYNEAYLDTKDEKYKIIADSYDEIRKDLLQRMALWGSFGSVDEYHGEFQGDMPIITIESKTYGDSESDRVSYVLTFSEFRNVGTVIAPVFSNFGNSTITVDPCMEGMEISMYQTSLAEDAMINQFVPGFTPEGYENGTGQYVFESVLGLGNELTDDYTFNQVPDGIGYVKTAVQSICGAVMDYQAGVEGATAIEDAFDDTYIGIMYDHFGFYSTPVTYDIADGQNHIQYAQPGADTVSAIQDYNSETGEHISINGIMYFPEETADSILEYYGIESSESTESTESSEEEES